MRNFLLFLPVWALLVTACDNGEYVPEATYNLPEKITSDSGFVYSFVYDAQNRLLKLTEADTVNNKLYTYDFTYKNNVFDRKRTHINAEEKEEVRIWRYTTLTQNRVRVNIIDVERGVHDTISSDTLLINTKQQLIEYRGYTYENSTSGNVIKRINKENQSEQLFTYDTKKPLFADIKALQWFMVSIFHDMPFKHPYFVASNITSETLSTAESKKQTYEYEYNEGLFPVKITYTDTLSRSTVFAVTYY